MSAASDNALMKTVVTIDGPSGAGKGTISQLLAKALGWEFLDSGAIYRLCGLACLKAAVDKDNIEAIVAIAEHLDIAFKVTDQGLETYLSGEEVGAQLRSETTAAAASDIASIGAVRNALLQRQRDFAVLIDSDNSAQGLIADGRDMGTVVFPQAPCKFYLTATAEERANRRYNQLKSAGESVNLAAILQDIKDRDDKDMNRAVAPLKPAEDAIIIDSTDMSIDTVFKSLLEIITDNGLQ